MSANIKINIVAPGDPTPIDPVVPNTGLFTHGIGAPEATIIATASILILLAMVIFFIVRRKKGLHIIKPSKHTSAIFIFLAIITSIGTFTGLMLNSIKSNTNAAEGDTENSLTVTESSEDLTIEVADTPVFAVLPVELTVAESTAAGYTLTAYTDNTDLVSTTDGSKVIPMVAADEGELVALADNTYGLSLVQPEDKDNEVYITLSTDQSNPTIIKSIDDYSPTPAEDKTTIYYGFYITPDTPKGTYEGGVINYEAEANEVATVTFNGNGLYFNDDPEQTTNDVKYITGITEKTAKYSHTPNVNDEGEASGIVGYHGGDILNKVITIPGASKINVKLSYGGGYISGGYPAGFVSFWQGSHPDYTTGNNIGDAIKTCGTSDVTDGKFYGNRNNENDIIATECELEGNAVTFAYWTQGGGPSQGAIYGYYAVVTGYDADGNIIYLPGNTQVGGEYQDPAQDLPYIFLGWNEDKEATTATYESKDDIELNLPLTKGKTTELYAIWQHATKIHFDGNGSTSGEIPDKLLAPGKGTSLCSYYYSRDGYIFNNWNTKPDGSGESYGECYWYTAPTDQSVELNLYAQWTPVTTIVYDGNGGEGSGPTQTIRAGETGSIYGNQGYFSMNGYIFSHWNTQPDGSGETYYGGDQFTASDQSTTITLYAQWINGAILDTGATVNAKLKRLAGNSSAVYDTVDTNVTTIARASTLPVDFAPTNDNTISIDGSVAPVYVWYDADTTTIYYYTESDEIIMNPDSSSMFRNFRKLSDVTSIADWGTTYVTDMSYMFYYAGLNATTFSLDLSSWDTSKVTNMNSMFRGAGHNATTWSIGDISSWDTSKVTDMSYMFYCAGFNATTFSLDLSSWDTSKVTDMSYMFESAGYNATTWSIGDLSSWDTSKVTNMNSMFRSAGHNATTWSIGDISSWDTSKVTNMNFMFESAGYNATTWSIGDLSSWDTSNVTSMWSMFESAGLNATTWFIGDLSSWDTSKVTNMSDMFFCAGYNATTWFIGDLSSWDTSKVTNMSYMFSNAGYNATTWFIGDLSSWDTSKVTNMNQMFSSAGYNATTFSLDLSSWDTSKVTDMSYMFSYAGYNATTFSLDLSSWDTSKVTDMSYMFYYAGLNATTFSLDLSSWDTSSVMNMGGMFSYAGSNATTWSVIIPPKTGDLNNTTSAFYGQNSSIYADPPYNRLFTLAAQANSNTTNTTGSLNSVNNAEVPNQDNSSGNRSVYTTEGAENTENADGTNSDTTSTPSRQEPLGEYQNTTTTDIKDINIIIPVLIVIFITLGASALGILIYKSHRQEDE